MSVEQRNNGHDFRAPGSIKEPPTQPGFTEQSPRGFGGINSFASGPAATRYPSNTYGPSTTAAAPGSSAFGPPGYGSGNPRFAPPNPSRPAGPSPATGGFPVPGREPNNPPTGSFARPGQEFNPPPSGFAIPPGFGDPEPRYPAGNFDSRNGGDRPNTFAILSLVFAFVSPLAGLVLGIIAKMQIARSGERGGGMALAGIIVGALLSVCMIAVMIFMIVAYHDMTAALSAVPAAPVG
jgi:Domain of unknown function (DUF4190)